jgi:hypothetical protein
MGGLCRCGFRRNEALADRCLPATLGSSALNVGGKIEEHVFNLIGT